MKKILYILFSVLIVFMVISCEDNLGYDPNVNARYIPENPEDTSSTVNSTKIEINSIHYDFHEHFWSHLYRVDWTYNVENISAYVDTSQEKTKVYFSIKASNLKDNKNSKYYKEWNESFEMHFEAVIDGQPKYLDSEIDGKAWIQFKYYVKQNDNVYSYFINGTQFGKMPYITFDEKREEGYVQVYIRANFEGFSLYPLQFHSIIDLYY